MKEQLRTQRPSDNEAAAIIFPRVLGEQLLMQQRWSIALSELSLFSVCDFFLALWVILDLLLLDKAVARSRSNMMPGMTYE